MRFPSMLRRLRNVQGGGTRSTSSTPYTPYMPEPPVDPPMPPPAAPGAVPIPPTSPSVPVARITSDQDIVSVGTTVNFDGSASTGRNLTYSWAFGTGAQPATATTPMASCKYTTPGPKIVTLIVTDDRGVESDVATLNIRVIEVTLAANPQSVLVGTAVTFTGTVSNAPDGANLTYLWAFGDEKNPTAGGSGVRVPYTYTTHGLKTATLTVSYTDTNGDLVEASDDLKVTVIFMESQTVEDGESPVFSVLGPSSVLDADTTTFSWGWSISNPDQSGNNPAVVFLPPEPTEPPNTTTIDRAKWYAFPDKVCAPGTSIYTIRCTVTTSNDSATVEAELSVTLPNIGGETKHPTIASYIAEDGTDDGGVGFTFDTQSGNSQKPYRLDPNSLKQFSNTKVNLNRNSQFYTKVLLHENEHVKQWKTGPMSQYFTVNGFLDHITNSGVTVRDLKSKYLDDTPNEEGDLIEGISTLVDRAYNNWNNEQEHLAYNDPNYALREEGAYRVSDDILPHYFYQAKCADITI